jgi:hypothetical protein
MQQNVGTIAACAPSLKPLVSKALGLSTSGGDSNAYGPGGYGSRGAGGIRTIGGAAGSALRSKTRDHYELRDLDEEQRERQENRTGGAAGYGRGKNDTTVTFYKSNSEGERSGSEEMILGSPRSNFKGIVRTTEVIVK